jgi:uncharacterized protein (DUF433 family)
MIFQRITLSHNVNNGNPCPRIRDLDFPVSRLLGLLATGETSETILKTHPELEAEDIQEALIYAAVSMAELNYDVVHRMMTLSQSPQEKVKELIQPPEEESSAPGIPKRSKWAIIAEKVHNDRSDVGDFWQQFRKSTKEFRDNFEFANDR